MNIQIFGTKKSSDTRKAERFFKERGIKFQFVDLKEKAMSKGEFQSVLQAVGGLDAMIDQNCKDKDLLALIKYIAAEDRAQKRLKHIWTAWNRISRQKQNMGGISVWMGTELSVVWVLLRTIFMTEKIFLQISVLFLLKRNIDIKVLPDIC